MVPFDKPSVTDLGVGLPARNATELGAVLAHARHEAGLDQDELAEWVSLTREYVGELERGAHATKLDRLLSVFDVLGLEVVVRRRRVP